MSDSLDGPVLDPAGVAQLLEMTGGDRDFLAELLDAFRADAGRQLEELRAAAAVFESAGTSTEAFVRPAHSLKGNSANIGAYRLVALARTLEADARAGSVEDPDARISAIADELAAVERALAAISGPGTATDEP